MDLNQRDIIAIAYSKSLLTEGDTLVSIRYPRDHELYDPAGFKLSSKKHRVHSERLLSTGSTVFQRLLSTQAQQRAQKRAGYTSTNPVPAGIKYILDLTPPDEGDEAVELTSNLSCSPGIRLWATTAAKFGADSRLVGGRDEFVRPQHYPIEEEGPGLSPVEDGVVKVQEVPEYCPIRHRAGIERLLRIIEGLDPRLDSAPKVLTLAVLGKYFDCKKVVAGFIESWIMTEPNNKFIEILPEAAFQIGLYVYSTMIIELAFAVLVSEGAFLAAARMEPDFQAGKNNTTQFGRPKEDLNEDELNRIEAASNDFQSRINGIASKLTEPAMTWLQDLPEFRKLIRFKESTFPSSKMQHAKVQLTVDKLVKLLNNFVRGRIMAVGIQSITHTQNLRANSNRSFEHYLEPYDGNFEYLYDTLSYSERYLTRFYWDLLSDMQWHIGINSNVCYYFEGNAVSSEIDSKALHSKGIPRVDMWALTDAQEAVNALMLSEVKDGNFYGGHIPPECYTKPEPKSPPIFPLEGTKLDPFWHVNVDHFYEHSPKVVVNEALAAGNPAQDAKSIVNPPVKNESSASTHTVPIVRGILGVPSDVKSDYTSLPFFSLPKVLSEVQAHLSNVCRSMLVDQYFGVRSFVDTLVCMSDEELKYLPLWAGGNEDGTGGVFEKPIPPAEFGVAPNGPGPAYHTGLSVFSQTSSIVDIDEDDQMTEVGTVNTSIAVENGFSSHVDRRIIMSDFGSIASYVDVRDYEETGSSKEVERKEAHDLSGEVKGKEVDLDEVHDYKDNGKGKSKEVELVDEEDFMIVSDDEDDLEDIVM